jgi:hypothetical protein
VVVHFGVSAELQSVLRESTIWFMARTKKRTMSDDHKKAIAEGREQSKAVSAYLDALETNKPKRGRKRTPESIDKQLAALDDKLSKANALARLQIIQDRMDLLAAKETLQSDVDLTSYEDDFIGVAKMYGERKGISYAAWRELGVPASALKRAGIGRGAR